MKRLLSFVIALFSCLTIYAEHEYSLFNALNSEQDHHYIANSHISLLAGFFSEPRNGHEALLEINSYDVSPPTMGITGGPPTNNTNGVVGAIGGTIDISQLGGAVYNIPIDVPEGLGGIKPQISISYNSQGRNGLLGWGWDLCGLSSITRTGSTFYYDGFISTADYTNDRFCLDGQRLLKISSGSYGGHGTSYRTEQDQMSKIVSYYESGINGPSYFKVWTADGKILYYGSSDDSKALLTTQNRVNIWLLKKVEDRNGNQMTYYYTNESDTYRINRITYSGNSSDKISPVFSVKFHYATRSDVETAYIGNCIFLKKSLLKKITISNGSNVMYTYSFSYQSPQPHNGYSYHLLTKIGFAAGEMHYNPTKIKWGENNYQNTSSNDLKMNVTNNTDENAFVNAIKFSGDFNGDGFTDIVALRPNWFGSYPAADVFINKGVNGTLFFEQAQSIPIELNISWIQVADFNGDGLDDILCSYRTRANFPFPDLIDTEIYLSRCYGDNICFRKYQAPPCQVPHYAVETHLVGDFFGEGKNSFLIQVVSADNIVVRFSLLFTYNDEDDRFDFTTTGEYLDANRFFAMDFNGDGVTEILYQKTDGSTCIAKLTNGNGSLQFSELYTGSPSNWNDCFLGDYNGDGIIDALFYTEGEQHPWTIYLFKKNGISNTSYTLPSNFPYASPGNYQFTLDQPNHTMQYIKTGDYDGNGCADISLYHDDNFYVFYGPLRTDSDDAPFANKQIFNAQQFGRYDNMNICIGNFLGQEGQAFLGPKTLSHLPPMTWRHEIKRITDGMGRNTELQYDYLMPNPDTPSEDDFYRLYSTSFNHCRQVFNTSIPLRALKNVTTYNVNNKPMEIRCFYEGALLHRQGKGFLGFNKTRQDDYCNHQLQKKTIRQYDIYYTDDIVHPVLTEEYIYDNNTQLMAKSVHDEVLYTHVNNAKVYVSVAYHATEAYDMQNPNRLLKKEINELTVSTHCSQSLKYNDVVSVIRQAKGVTAHQNYNLASSCEYQEITNTTYLTDNLSTWLINRPATITHVKHRNGDYNDIYQHRIIGYNSNKPHQISYVIDVPNDGTHPEDRLTKRTDYLYDPTGNIISQTISTPYDDLAPRQELFEYGKAFGRRLLTKYTNALNQTWTYDYDPVYSYNKSTTDCHGLVTQNEQDPLGRNFTTHHPDGTITCKALRWGNNYYYSWEKKTGQPTQITHYAWTGEPLRSRSYDINGASLFSDIQYDDKGRIIGKTLPYRLGDDSKSITYQYDSHDRVNRINHTDGTYETIEYDGNEKSTTFFALDGSTQSESKTFNTMGWVVKSTDTEGNSIINDYFADGSPKWSQIEGHNETRMEMAYDALGNRISLFDPNYGLTTCEYNAFNEMTKQISPKLDETVYCYDVLGNPVQRIENDKKNNRSETTEWIYGQEPKNSGLLIRITSPNQTIDYEYDDLLRLKKTSENCLGEIYHTWYAYDDASRTSSIIFPSNYSINYSYTSEGVLRSVMDSESKVLWKTSEANPMMQPTRCMTGNGLVTHLDYDENTSRLTSIHTTCGDKKLQNYTYEYDGYSNMTHRNDLVNTISESFSYDPLNRLTSAIDQHGVSSFSYDPLGRMISKTSPSGTVFTNADYSGNKPHAIKSVQSSNGAFPQERMDLLFNSFDKVSSINEGTNHVSYDYGFDHQRIRAMENINGKTRSKIYVGNCEFINEPGNNAIVRTMLSGPTGIFAVAETRNGKTNLHYIHKDHLGSWVLVSDSNGTIEQETHFDAWGNCDNADNLMFDRGFTGHEHIRGMGLINMNGRLYDPVTSSMLSPDNNIQMPDFTQNLNRYAYCLNNPLTYTDPDGNSFIGSALMFYMLFCSDYGYEIQKFFSPIAFHFDLHLSSQQLGIGFDISTGIPKSSPFSVRAHYGATYYLAYYGNSHRGWEQRMGIELYALGCCGLSSTCFSSGETSQITNAIIIGNENWGVTYENDYMFHLGDRILGVFASDNGDRYRSAAAKIRIGPFIQIGVNLFTGDPGVSHNHRNVYYDRETQKWTYGTGRDGENPDEYRAGVFYIGFGPFRMGGNSEEIRNLFQNRFAHDFLCQGDSPYFKALNRPPQTYFYFGTGTGNTLW